MQALEASYDDFASGRRQPADEDESTWLGILALRHGEPQLALRWLESATAAAKITTDSVLTTRHLLVAHSQLLAHCLAGKRVDVTTLQLHLASARRLFARVLQDPGADEPGLEADLVKVRRTCAIGWLNIEEIAPLREASRHPLLPEAERAAWAAFWAQTEAIAGGK
jgi:hypothetical protein